MLSRLTRRRMTQIVRERRARWTLAGAIDKRSRDDNPGLP
jgi:hypothetical protein